MILVGLRLVFGSLRVSEETEMQGLDLSERSESAYGLTGPGMMAPEAGVHGVSLGLGLAASAGMVVIVVVIVTIVAVIMVMPVTVVMVPGVRPVSERHPLVANRHAP